MHNSKFKIQKMELILQRIAKRKDYTIGRLAILTEENEEYRTYTHEEYLCDTLEPPVLAQKTTVSQDAVLRSVEKARSMKPFAIPEGRYAVVITYSPKFQEWLPLLLGGPDFNRLFQGIRIHAGNTVKDTQGCILVGQNLKPGQVFNSRTWLKRLKDIIVEAKSRNEPVFLTIQAP